MKIACIDRLRYVVAFSFAFFVVGVRVRFFVRVGFRVSSWFPPPVARILQPRSKRSWSSVFFFHFRVVSCGSRVSWLSSPCLLRAAFPPSEGNHETHQPHETTRKETSVSNKQVTRNHTNKEENTKSRIVQKQLTQLRLLVGSLTKTPTAKHTEHKKIQKSLGSTVNLNQAFTVICPA